MPPPNLDNKLMQAPFADIVTVLLTQFKRLLDERGVSLTKAQIDAIGESSQRKAWDEIQLFDSIRTVLVELVEESQSVLQEQFGFTFTQSIEADMSAVDGWETTADFLERANHKSNAELRMSAGASLLAALGDVRYRDILLAVIQQDAGANDVDATLAKRVLAHATDIPLDTKTADWAAAVAAWQQNA